MQQELLTIKREQIEMFQAGVQKTLKNELNTYCDADGQKTAGRQEILGAEKIRQGRQNSGKQKKEGQGKKRSV